LISGDLPFDLERLGEVLRRHAVNYVIIGGACGTFHGMLEYRTKDVDLLVQETTLCSRAGIKGPYRMTVDGLSSVSSPRDYALAEARCETQVIRDIVRSANTITAAPNRCGPVVREYHHPPSQCTS
jgi:hypothetical protein